MSIRSRLTELEREVNNLRFIADLQIKQVNNLEKRTAKMEISQSDLRDHLTDVIWNEEETGRAVKLILDHLGFDVECVKEYFKLVKRK